MHQRFEEFGIVGGGRSRLVEGFPLEGEWQWDTSLAVGDNRIGQLVVVVGVAEGGVVVDWIGRKSW